MARTIRAGGTSEYSSVVKARKEQMKRDIEAQNKVIAKKKAIGKKKRGGKK